MLSMPWKRKKRRKKKYLNRTNSAQHFKDWATIGRQIKVNGKDLTVYTRGKLVEAFAQYGIPRSYQTVLLWETNGLLPKSPIIIGRKRYYTRSMIEAIVLTFLESGAEQRTVITDSLKQKLHEEVKKALERELLE